MPSWPSVLLLFVLLASLPAAVVVPPGEGQAAGDGSPQRNSIIATPWDVRRQAQELMADLVDKRIDQVLLLDRTQSLLREHGDALIAYQGGWTPLSDAIGRHLAATGHLDAFRDQFAGPATRRLKRILAEGGTIAALLGLARDYPGTEAADRAWRLIADRAWDRGRLGTYLSHAETAGDHRHERLQQRIAAARDLVRYRRNRDLPASLSNLGAMWSIAGLPALQRQQTDSDRQQLINRTGIDPDQLPISHFAFGTAPDGLVAACDGRRLVIFDPLVGNRIGPIHTVGQGDSLRQAPEPVWAGDRCIAVGTANNDQPVLLCVDRRGRQLWKTDPNDLAQARAFAEPVIVEDMVVLAYTQHNNPYAELHAVAMALSDGKVRWNKRIATAQNLQGHMYGLQHLFGPMAVSHEGAMVVCSNTGLLAKVAADGSVSRIWSYPTRPMQMNPRFGMPTQQLGRNTGRIRSDGKRVLLTARDNNVLVMLDTRSGVSIYDGNGAGDDLVDADGDAALLVGERLSLIDLRTLKPRWSHRTGTQTTRTTGLIGDRHALTSLGGLVYLQDLETGSKEWSMFLPANASLGVTEGILVTCGPSAVDENEQIIIGFGDRSGFERLQAKAAERPDDFRPLLALASLHLARGDADEPFEYLIKALAKGAPEHHAIEAARLARHQLDLGLGGDAFNIHLERFARLEHYDPGFIGERHWWQARHAELLGDTTGAIAAYRAALNQPTASVVLSDGLRADCHALCRAGLARLGQGETPNWLQPQSGRTLDLATARTGPTATDGWLEPPLISGNVMIGYRHGHLTAIDRSSGETIWVKGTSGADRPMLGVYWDRKSQVGPNVAIRPIPGTAGMEAGLVDGDRMIVINNKQIAKFQTLVDEVVAAGVGGQVTLGVDRPDGSRISLEVTLGNRLLRPLHATDRWVIAQGVSLDLGDDKAWTVRPDETDPRIEIIDITTGEVHWTRSLQPREQERPSAVPQLLDDQYLIMANEDQRSAYRLDRADGKPVWQLTGLGDEAIRLEVLGPGTALIARPEDDGFGILDLASGQWSFHIPADTDGPYLLDQGRLFVRGSGNSLNCYDLGLGRKVWTADAGNLTPRAIFDKQLYVTDQRRRLRILDARNGKDLRSLSQWIQVTDLLVHDDRLYLRATRTDQTRVLAAINLRAGTMAWERPTPHGLDLFGPIRIAGDHIVCTFDHLQEDPSVLVIGRDGTPIAARQLAPEQTILIQHDTAQVRGLDATEAIGALPPRSDTIVACPDITGDDNKLEELVASVIDTITWTEHGGAAFATWRTSNGRLLLLARPRPDLGLRIHIGDQGPILDHQGQRIIAPVGTPPTYAKGVGGWAADRITLLPDKQDKPIIATLLTPPVDRQVGSALQIHLEVVGDDDPTPWWYRPAWSFVDWRDATP